MDPAKTVRAFDSFLAARGLRLQAIVIGGAALNLMGVVSRATKDFDVLVPTLTDDLISAAREFAVAQRAAGDALADDWLNNGPVSLLRQLPADWQAHVTTIFRGTAVEIQSLGRLDLLRSKLFALCDRAIDLPDCVALAPSAAELEAIRRWLEFQDANPDWPAHVRDTLSGLARRIGHGV